MYSDVVTGREWRAETPETHTHPIFHNCMGMPHPHTTPELAFLNWLESLRSLARKPTCTATAIPASKVSVGLVEALAVSALQPRPASVLVLLGSDTRSPGCRHAPRSFLHMPWPATDIWASDPHRRGALMAPFHYLFVHDPSRCRTWVTLKKHELKVAAQRFDGRIPNRREAQQVHACLWVCFGGLFDNRKGVSLLLSFGIATCSNSALPRLTYTSLGF